MGREGRGGLAPHHLISWKRILDLASRQSCKLHFGYNYFARHLSNVFLSKVSLYTVLLNIVCLI